MSIPTLAGNESSRKASQPPTTRLHGAPKNEVWGGFWHFWQGTFGNGATFPLSGRFPSPHPAGSRRSSQGAAGEEREQNPLTGRSQSGPPGQCFPWGWSLTWILERHRETPAGSGAPRSAGKGNSWLALPATASKRHRVNKRTNKKNPKPNKTCWEQKLRQESSWSNPYGRFVWKRWKWYSVGWFGASISQKNSKLRAKDEFLKLYFSIYKYILM